MYVGLSFFEMDNNRLWDFFRATDIKKFEMAFWAENINSKKSFRFGFFLGVFTTLIITMIIVTHSIVTTILAILSISLLLGLHYYGIIDLRK